MGERALAVVIAALIKDNKILLVKRAKGDYIGLWGMPGGKVELNEHLSHAATREILEESGIESEFVAFRGIVSEHLVENNAVTGHFLLHVCELNPKTTEIRESGAGKFAWFDLSELENMKSQIIPSDFPMIQKIIRNKEGKYYNCVITKNGSQHTLTKFEMLS